MIFPMTQGWVSCAVLAWDALGHTTDPLGRKDAPGLCEMGPGSSTHHRGTSAHCPSQPYGSHSQGAEIAN